MSLPVISYPIFDVTIPSTKKTVKARPFLVKEHKLLLQGVELRDSKSFTNTITAIISACLFDKVDVTELSMYDIDYLFLVLRARSVGEIIPIRYVCKAMVGEDDTKTVCNSPVLLNLNINDINVNVPEDFSKNSVIQVNDTIGIKLRSPTFKQYNTMQEEQTEENNGFSISTSFIFSCIECIYDGEKVMIPGVDFTLEETKEFLDNLQLDVSKRIDKCLSNMPYVSLKTELTCPKCGNKDTVEVRELEDFFV